MTWVVKLLFIEHWNLHSKILQNFILIIAKTLETFILKTLNFNFFPEIRNKKFQTLQIYSNTNYHKIIIAPTSSKLRTTGNGYVIFKKLIITVSRIAKIKERKKVSKSNQQQQKYLYINYSKQKFFFLNLTLN